MAGDRNEQWANGGTDQSGSSGDETTKHKREVITWINTMLEKMSVNSWKAELFGERKTYPDRAHGKR